MFDMVRFEVSLPDGCTGEWQTKSFDCTLATILITQGGRLLLEEVEYENEATEELSSHKGSKVGCLTPLPRKSLGWRD